MSDKMTLLLFLLLLFTCLLTGIPVLWALLGGWTLFMLYGFKQGHSLKALLGFSIKGIGRVRNILFTFVLIGMMTAAWRAAGTIPYITLQASRLISPSGFVLLTFLLCAFVSLLMGTSFGTAATMGVICLSVSHALGLNPAYTGGAMLAGIYFGDRCSPMSTSALLVAALTETNIYTNIRLMLKTAWVPLFLSCILYFLLGLNAPALQHAPDIAGLFGKHFALHLVTFVPAAAIILLSVLKVRVQVSMAVSILLSLLIAVLLQGRSPSDMLNFLLKGFTSQDVELNRLLQGGGILSMVRTGLIVGISATYSGLFEGTGLLNNLKTSMEKLGKKTTPFGGVLLTALFTSFIGFNQTLPVMLTHQLCKDMVPDNQRLAIMMENSVIVIPALVPWSIAGTVPLITVGAPLTSIPFAVFLYLLPLWQLGISYLEKRKGIAP